MRNTTPDSQNKNQYQIISSDTFAILQEEWMEELFQLQPNEIHEKK